MLKYFMPLVILATLSCRATVDDHEGSEFYDNGVCEMPWAFFDLGETLIDTKTSNFKKIFYLNGARSYLTMLKQNKVHLGMLINVPEAWGKTKEEKMAKLHETIDTSWSDPNAPGFDWDFFDQASIILPPSDALRKPNAHMFKEASDLARKAGCKSVFQGEEPAEVDVAKSTEMTSFLVRRKIDGSGVETPQFMALSEIKNAAR